MLRRHVRHMPDIFLTESKNRKVDSRSYSSESVDMRVFVITKIKDLYQRPSSSQHCLI